MRILLTLLLLAGMASAQGVFSRATVLDFPGQPAGTVPAPPANTGRIYYNSTTNTFIMEDSTGTNIGPGGGGLPTGCTGTTGNITCTSFTSSSANGGITGTEGTGAGLTAGVGVDLLYPDSTAHRWKMNSNNGGAVIVASTTDAVTLSQLPASSKIKSCQISLGDGLNAITAGTYPLKGQCYNDTGATLTVTGVKCFSDNTGTTSCDAATNAPSDLLTSAVTATAAFAAGSQSATTTITSGQWLTVTFVADGTTKVATLVVTGTL